MLQVGRSQVGDYEANDFLSVYLILPAALGPRFTQLLRQMSIRRRKIIFLGSRELPVRKADNLTDICESTV
jgi:hypothetical protein